MSGTVLAEPAAGIESEAYVATGAERPLRNQAFGAITWTAAQRWLARVTGFATILVLTRNLSPADFGTVAVASAVLPVVYLLADMGFSTYIVQAAAPTAATLSTAFWFNAAAGAGLSALFFASGPVVAALFDVPGAAGVMYGLAPATLCVTLSAVPMALLRRRLAFRRLALQAMVAALVGQAVAVALALGGWGVWALVAQAVLNQAVVAVLAWRAARWWPSLTFQRSELRSLVSFGANVMGVELVETLRALAENAIIAAAMGVGGLGYVNVAQRLAQLVQDVSAAAILPVSTVVFARVRATPGRLREVYLTALPLTYAAVAPAMVFLVVSAPVLLPTLFGHQWRPSVGPSQLLAVAGVIVLGAMLDHGLCYGAGRPGVWFGYALVVDGLTVASALITARFGPVAWASGFVVVAVVATVLRWPMVGSVIGAPWRVVAGRCARATLVAAVTAAAGFGMAWLCRAASPAVMLPVVAVVVVLAQIAAMRVVLPGELRVALGMARLDRLRVRRGRPHGAAVASPGERRMPRVSVVVPCHNYVQFIDQAIASALEQEGVDVDVTIVDDASTDGSLEHALAWQRRDERVRVRAHATNQGHIVTFNEALESATAPYVVKLDPDDILPAGTLRRSADVLEAHPDVVFVYGHVLNFRGAPPVDLPTAVRSVQVWRGERWLRWRARRVRNVVWQPEIMIRRTALLDAGGHRAEVPASSDFHLWLRLAARGPVARVRGPVQGLMRQHESSMQTTLHAGKLVDFRARLAALDLFVAEEGHRLRDPGGFRRTYRRRLAKDAIRLAFEELADGHDTSAYLADARALRPGITRTLAWRSINAQALAGAPTWWGWPGRVQRDLKGRINYRFWRRYGL